MLFAGALALFLGFKLAVFGVSFFGKHVIFEQILVLVVEMAVLAAFEPLRCCLGDCLRGFALFLDSFVA